MLLWMITFNQARKPIAAEVNSLELSLRMVTTLASPQKSNNAFSARSACLDAMGNDPANEENSSFTIKQAVSPKIPGRAKLIRWSQ